MFLTCEQPLQPTGNHRNQEDIYQQFPVRILIGREKLEAVGCAFREGPPTLHDLVYRGTMFCGHEKGYTQAAN